MTHAIKFLDLIQVVLTPLAQCEQESLNDGLTISCVFRIGIINNLPKKRGVMINKLAISHRTHSQHLF